MENNVWIPAKIRNIVSKRDAGVCQHCGKIASRADISPRGILRFFDENNKAFHLDHVIPTLQGGRHTADNLVVSCQDCNLKSRRKVAEKDPIVLDILARFNN